MTDPDRLPEQPSRDDVALWILVGLMVLIAVGGLVYGLAYPSIYATNPAADRRLRSRARPVRPSDVRARRRSGRHRPAACGRSPTPRRGSPDTPRRRRSPPAWRNGRTECATAPRARLPGSLSISWRDSVITVVGAMALTRMFLSAHSIASIRVI